MVATHVAVVDRGKARSFYTTNRCFLKSLIARYFVVTNPAPKGGGAVCGALEPIFFVLESWSTIFFLPWSPNFFRLESHQHKISGGM